MYPKAAQSFESLCRNHALYLKVQALNQKISWTAALTAAMVWESRWPLRKWERKCEP